MTNSILTTCRKPALFRWSVMLATVLTVIAYAGLSYAAEKQKTFKSAEEAVKALVAAGRNDDMKELSAILGPDSKDILSSGDEVADRQSRERFIAAYDEKNTLNPEGKDMVLVIGKQDWPFPIPVVKKGGSWYFDTKKGREEILDRRIGRNELDTIQTCLAIVDAQYEYAMEGPGEDKSNAYAEKFISDPGKKNGLYWPAAEGEKPSPLGPLVAEAVKEGYKKKEAGEPVPYNGYYYRMLMSQGKHAPDGAYDYVVNGKMMGGFAVVAYPATYGNSGVMTFIVNQDGVVYQKDLGEDTAKLASAIKKYDPDSSWKKTAE